MGEGALENLRVVDLSENVSGPYCTKLLAGFGAQVIKLERPKSGDCLRSQGPFFRSREGKKTSIPFLWLNTGKMSVALDLEKERGVAIAKELIRQADVVLESFPPGTMEKLGLGYETLAADTPRLVMTSVSDFGQSGPYRDFVADEIQLQALSGMMYLTGDPERAPLASGPALCQYSAGMHAYLATLLGVFQREMGGRAQHIDVSKMDCGMESIEIALTAYLQTGARAVRKEQHLGVPWDLYECEDGYAAVISMPARHWHRAEEIFGDPRLFEKKYEHILGRIRHREEYEQLIKDRLKGLRREELFREGQSRGLAFGYLSGVSEAFDSPQHRERGFFVETDHPETGRHEYCGAPFVMSQTPWRQGRAPLLGEHNEQVLGGILGYSQDRIDRLREEGVIG